MPTEHRMKIKENEKRDKFLGLTRELKKAMEHESDGDTNYNWCVRNDLQRLGEGDRGVGNWMTNQDHLNCSIV